MGPRVPFPVLVLERGEVHIWKACLDVTPTLASRYESFLSTEELKRGGRFRVACDHHCFVVYRGVLRCLLGGYLGVPPACVPIGLGDRGKPLLGPLGGQRLEFNMSHSRGLALYAFSRTQEVGIDVEYLDTGIDEMRLAAWIMDSGQLASLRGLPRIERAELVYRAWVRMEAVGKAKGLGLAEMTDGKEETIHWSISGIDAGTGYAAALAVKGEPPTVRFLDWQEGYPV